MDKKPNKYNIKPNGKNDTGRPTVMTSETVVALCTAFTMGCSDIEACAFAGIGTTALYEYQKHNPEFTERKKLLRETVAVRARHVVEKAINEGDKDMAKWYLERKKKDEFSTKVENNGNAMGVIIQVASQDQIQRANKQIDAIIDGNN